MENLSRFKAGTVMDGDDRVQKARARHHQVGALPWRMRNGTLQVLLVTTLTTRRWVIPKGWPHSGRGPSRSAAIEAWEESGVTGKIGRKPVGHFAYEKVRDEDANLDCVVSVYALKVATQAQDWPEKAIRDCRWFDREDAARAVVEPELSAIIRRFDPATT